MSMMVMLLVLVAMWAFMLRAQKKQKQERQNLLNSMQAGSQVVTIGGLHGEISDVDTVADTVTLNCEGIYLTFDRAAIRTVKPATVVTNDDAVTTVEVEEVTEVTATEKD